MAAPRLSSSTELLYGFGATSLAVVLYGSYLVPMRRGDPLDGVFFQWVMCASIWSTAQVVDLALGTPQAPPLALLGGAVWATGNMAMVPTVKLIGLGLCVLLSSSSNLLMGWASSRFGWFGVSPEEVNRPILNSCGAGLCLISGIFFFVKSNVEPCSESTPLLIEEVVQRSRAEDVRPEVKVFKPRTRRVIGCLMAVVSGLLYGSTFAPVLYIKDHALFNGSRYYGASQHDVDYVSSQCTGVFLASTAYLIFYCILKRNQPQVQSTIILPALLCGMMWTTATYCWFLANYFLGAAVTFPILSAGYGLVAALWGSLFFKEVKGPANLLLFCVASSVVLAGSLLTAVSKI